MVDPVGAKPVRSLDRPVGSVAPSNGARQVAPVASGAEHAEHAASVADAARAAAQAAPVDHERVATLRAAIASGNYRPAPETIADALIGHMQEWIAR